MRNIEERADTLKNILRQMFPKIPVGTFFPPF